MMDDPEDDLRSTDPWTDLRRRIISLDLPPRAALSRSELQERYQLSSTPIRDALLKLQAEGLVEIRPQSRTLVTLIDLEQARQAHFLRSTLEQEICRRVSAAPNVALVEILERLIALQIEAGANDMALFAQLDLAFHRELFAAMDLLHVHAIIRRESVHIDRIRSLHLHREDKIERIIRDHQRIVAALRSEGPDAAGTAMADHLSHTISIANEMRRERPAYFTP